MTFKQSLFAQVLQVFCLGFVGSTVIFAASSTSAPDAASIAWRSDLNAALQDAAKIGKPVLVHFYSNNCVPCKMLDAKAFKHPGVCQAMAETVIPVKINVDHHRQLADRYQIQRWPTDLYLFPNGQELYRGISPQDPDDYTKLLARVSQRNRDWIAERIANRPAESTQAQRSPRLASVSTSTPVSSQSRHFQTASRVTDEPIEDSATTNPYCVSQKPDSPGSNPPPSTASVPVHLASQSILLRENRYQTRSSSPNSTSPNAPRPSPQGSSTDTKPVAASGLANVTIGGVFADEATIDLDGYCPVSLLARSEWVLGNPGCAVKHRGRVYFCINEEAQGVFLAAPDRFAPVLSGYDIVHFLDTGELIPGRREHGCRFGLDPDRERVFLFANQANRQRFDREAIQYALSLGRTDSPPENTSADRIATSPNQNQWTR